MAVIDINSVRKHCSSFLLLEERSLRDIFLKASLVSLAFSKISLELIIIHYYLGGYLSSTSSVLNFIITM